MTWSTRAIFRTAGIVFFGALVLQAIFAARYVDTVTNAFRMTMRGISTNTVTSATWYGAVFEPILVGVVGLLVGFGLGEIGEALAPRDRPPADAGDASVGASTPHR